MNILTDIQEWQALRKQLFNKTIGFIPTMGNLHVGHLSLCERSKAENEITVVSIFVNATQFNQVEDFEKYPRTLLQDQNLLADKKVDYLLLPEPKAMYPDDYEVKVSETTISTELEGEFRPGHFNGMLTIVLKLLNLVQPAKAYFGEKDFQQLLLIKKMAQALFLPTQIIECETVRAADGLALSSRNSRLTPEQRIFSQKFPELLQGSLNVEEIKLELEKLSFKVDYIAEKWQRRLGAVWVDNVRLIDNIAIK
jgi:pantoate--beta-alanine ligase